MISSSTPTKPHGDVSISGQGALLELTATDDLKAASQICA